jgi:hypothetical protein
MVFWKRLLITLAVMVAAGYLAGFLWQRLFQVALPGYLAGVVGGMTALPVWEFLKHTGRRRR